MIEDCDKIEGLADAIEDAWKRLQRALVNVREVNRVKEIMENRKLSKCDAVSDVSLLGRESFDVSGLPAEIKAQIFDFIVAGTNRHYKELVDTLNNAIANLVKEVNCE